MQEDAGSEGASHREPGDDGSEGERPPMNSVGEVPFDFTELRRSIIADVALLLQQSGVGPGVGPSQTPRTPTSYVAEESVKEAEREDRIPILQTGISQVPPIYETLTRIAPEMPTLKSLSKKDLRTLERDYKAYQSEATRAGTVAKPIEHCIVGSVRDEVRYGYLKQMPSDPDVVTSRDVLKLIREAKTNIFLSRTKQPIGFHRPQKTSKLFCIVFYQIIKPSKTLGSYKLFCKLFCIRQNY